MQRTKQISPRAEQLVSEYGFGQVRAEYRENSLLGGFLLGGSLVVGLIILIGAWPSVSGQLIGLAFLWSCVGCFFLVGIAGIMTVIQVLQKGERYLYIGDQGYISVRRQVEKAVHWDAVEGIQRRVKFNINTAKNVPYVNITRTYTVLSAEDHTANMIDDEPGLMIEQAVTEHAFPRVCADYEAGKMLSFGWLVLNQEGLTFSSQLSERELTKIQGIWSRSGERFISWRDLACAWIDESKSTLIVSNRGTRLHWAIFPLYHVANSALCLALIEQILTTTPNTVD